MYDIDEDDMGERERMPAFSPRLTASSGTVRGYNYAELKMVIFSRQMYTELGYKTDHNGYILHTHRHTDTDTDTHTQTHTHNHTPVSYTHLTLPTNIAV